MRSPSMSATSRPLLLNVIPDSSQSQGLESDVAGVDRSPLLVGLCVAGLSSILTLLSFAALLNSRGPLPSNLRLVLSLITSDALTCLAVALKLSYELQATADMHACFELLSSSLRMTAHAATLLNLTLLAVDVFFAIKVCLILLPPAMFGSGSLRFAFPLLFSLLFSSLLRRASCAPVCAARGDRGAQV